MEAKYKISKSVAKTLAIITFGITVIVFFICVFMQLTPLQLELEVFDFAEHHYFMFGFISFLLGMLILRSYMLIYDGVSNPTKHQLKTLKSVFNISHKTKQQPVVDAVLNDNEGYSFIEKSKINALSFPREDVLNAPEQIKARELELVKSMSLGNRYKHKVKIFFRDINAKRYTETTIWYADTKYITIKGGIALPVRSIYKIEF